MSGKATDAIEDVVRIYLGGLPSLASREKNQVGNKTHNLVWI